jgi:hypothetical protein
MSLRRNVIGRQILAKLCSLKHFAHEVIQIEMDTLEKHNFGNYKLDYG